MNKKRYHHLLKLALLLMPMLTFGQNIASQNTGQDSHQSEITPSIGPLPNNSVDVILDAEFLWWYSNLTDLSYAIKGVTTPIGTAIPNTLQTSIYVPAKKEELDWGWDPGARVGLGVVTNHDGWDIYSEWTYFYNSLRDSSSVPVFDDARFDDD